MNGTMNVFSALDSFRKSRVRFRLTPLESTASLPIPLLLTPDKKVFLGLLMFTGKSLKRGEKIRLFRPHTKIVIEYPTGRIGFHQDYTVLDEFPTAKWDEPIGQFPHKAVESLTLKEYTEKRKELLQKYDPILSLFAKSESDAVLGNDFRQHFDEICEPDLLPFMKKVGKTFFKWLDGAPIKDL